MQQNNMTLRMSYRDALGRSEVSLWVYLGRWVYSPVFCNV